MSEHDDEAPDAEDTTPQASDPDRDAILRRRQRFIAAALSGLAAASAGCPSKPQVCLKVATTPKPQATAAPRVCLEALPPPSPTPAPSAQDEDLVQPDDGPRKPPPQPCLSVRKPDADEPQDPDTQDPDAQDPDAQDPDLAPPQPCLRVRRQD